MSAAIDNFFVTLSRMPEPERKFVTYKLLDVIDELRAANTAACDEATNKGLTGRAALRVFQRHFKAVFNQYQNLFSDRPKTKQKKHTYAKLHVSR
jgi:hypothetical protein